MKYGVDWPPADALKISVCVHLCLSAHGISAVLLGSTACQVPCFQHMTPELPLCCAPCLHPSCAPHPQPTHGCSPPAPLEQPRTAAFCLFWYPGCAFRMDSAMGRAPSAVLCAQPCSPSSHAAARPITQCRAIAWERLSPERSALSRLPQVNIPALMCPRSSVYLSQIWSMPSGFVSFSLKVGPIRDFATAKSC